MNTYNNDFWSALDELVLNSEIVIDRPKGTAHPKYPKFIYRLDYGYLKNTSSMDGDGIDVWVGSGEQKIDAMESQPRMRIQQIITAIVAALAGGLISAVIGMVIK